MRRGFLLLLLGLAVSSGAATTKTGDADPDSDLLRFVDGSTLHGRLKNLDFEHGLQWQYSAATTPIDFQPQHVDAVWFAHSSVLKLTPTCHVRFVNGDDLFGSLTGMDADHVELTTWFGDKLNVPRVGVRSVTFLSKGYTILYEGPYDREGWVTTAANGAGGWKYRDRGFTAAGPGLIGRDLGLTGSCTLEFNLTWSGYLGLAIGMYCESADRLDYNSPSYLVQFTRGRVVLQRLRATAVPRNLGMSPPVPALENPGTTHVALQFNKANSAVDLFVAGELVKEWKDEDGFSALGGCLIFEQTVPNTPMRISDLRISSWEAHDEPDDMRIRSWAEHDQPEVAANATNVDVLRFVNHDSAGGKIHQIKDGNITVDLAPGLLNIPMERLTQIDFAAITNAVAEAAAPNTVRAYFPGGGSLSFELEKWTDNLVEGHSAMFGRLAFQPSGIRELRFNLSLPRSEPGESAVNEFEDADE